MKSDIFVELGLPHGNATMKDEQDAFLSKIGGRPTWILKENNIHDNIFKCSLCHNVMYLILQMDCPCPGSDRTIDRIVYVFGCNTRECGMKPEGWKVFFQQKERKNETIENEESDSFYFDKNYPVFLPPKRLEIIEEIISERKSSENTHSGLMKSNREFVEENMENELYENSIPSNLDKKFTKFQKRTLYYPRQCVRYCPMGDPLPFNDNDIIPPSNCSICLKPRHFELQLMPAILSLMPVENEIYLKHLKSKSSNPFISNGMEWGTIMIYSCGNCQGGNVSHIDCHVHIQIEN